MKAIGGAIGVSFVATSFVISILYASGVYSRYHILEYLRNDTSIESNIHDGTPLRTLQAKKSPP